MKLRMWGVRGSIASPGTQTLRYGGNTTCLELRTDRGELIILDAGTGIFPLAQSLLREMPVKANIFITHTHWDHIQGLPFFTPLYIPGTTAHLFGPYNIVAASGIEQVMDAQLQYSYFPIREAELRAAIAYTTLNIGETVAVGDARVTGVLMNHPVVNLGYRVENHGKTFFFSGDHEPYTNIYSETDESYADYQAIIDEKQKAIEDGIRGTDVLVLDCSYTREEFAGKIGWGHGTFDSSIELALRVGAKTLICTHHEPTRSDEQLERVFAEALARHAIGDLKVVLASEGLEVEW